MSKRISDANPLNGAARNRVIRQKEGLLSAVEVRELIARRAYELYKRRDEEFGDELSDWLKAEGEVVTMLLAEPQNANEAEPPQGPRVIGRAGDSRAGGKANGGRPRASRRSKQNGLPSGTTA